MPFRNVYSSTIILGPGGFVDPRDIPESAPNQYLVMNNYALCYIPTSPLHMDTQFAFVDTVIMPPGSPCSLPFPKAPCQSTESTHH